MKINNKNFIGKMFCKHDYRNFETPINRKTNPHGFVSLNDDDDGIWVCIKCGKKLFEI
jgi:peptide methionine sulfoxide reductase MsrB